VAGRQQETRDGSTERGATVSWHDELMATCRAERQCGMTRLKTSHGVDHDLSHGTRRRSIQLYAFAGKVTFERMMFKILKVVFDCIRCRRADLDVWLFNLKI